MAVTWLDAPTEVTVGAAGSWTDVDLSSLIPSGATGVMLMFVSTAVFDTWAIGARKNGSTDNRTEGLHPSESLKMWTHAFVGVDASRVVELYVGSTTEVDVYVMGAFGSESVFFTNAVSHSLGGGGGWVDVSIAASTGADTAIAAFVEGRSNDSDYWEFGLRKNGSTDSFQSTPYWHAWGVTGVDANEVYEADGYCDYVYTIGYMKSGAALLTNWTNVTPTTHSAWVDLAALASGSSGGFFFSMNWMDSGFRKNGSAFAVHGGNTAPAWAATACDASGLVEVYDFNLYTPTEFLVGTIEAAAAATGLLFDQFPMAGGFDGMTGGMQ